MFSWDKAKNQGNQRKHGISFDIIAKLVFDDPLHISRQDRDEDGELRWQTIGRAGDIIVLLVAHTLYQTKTGEEHIRIISAHRATKLERKTYEQGS